MNLHEGSASEKVTTGAPRVARAWFFAKWFAVVGFFVGGYAMFGFGLSAYNPPPPPPGQGICGMGVMAGFFIMLLSPLGAIVCSLVAAMIGIILDLVFPRVPPLVRRGGRAIAIGIFAVFFALFSLFFAYPFLQMIPRASESLGDAVTLFLLLALLLTAIVGTAVVLLRQIPKP